MAIPTLSPLGPAPSRNDTGTFPARADGLLGQLPQFRDQLNAVVQWLVNEYLAELSNGTEALPSLAFKIDPNTGMWRPAADTIAFSTNGGERMRINPGGNIGIGTPTPQNTLHVNGSFRVDGDVRHHGFHYLYSPGFAQAGVSHYRQIAFNGDYRIDALDSAGAYNSRAYEITGGSGGVTQHGWYINKLIAALLASDGSFRVGSAGDSGPGNAESNTGNVLRANGQAFHSVASGVALYLNKNGDGAIQQFNRNGSIKGRISIDNGGVTFSSVSDRRAKNTIRDLNSADALARVNRMRPRSFYMNSNPGQLMRGVIADEFEQECPWAVQGTKDEVDASGNPVLQSVDLSKSIPDLISAIQELTRQNQTLIAQNESLSARIDALEGAK